MKRAWKAWRRKVSLPGDLIERDKRKGLLERLLFTLERKSLLEITNSFKIFFAESLYCCIMAATNLVIREKSAPLCSCVWGNPRVCSHDETKRTSSLMLCVSLLTAKRLRFVYVGVCV